MEKDFFRESVIMANELDVAGEFIYSAINKLNQMVSFEYIGEDFFFLYHLAVGFERMQKILLLIINDVQESDIKKFLDKIKTHNHQNLHGKIKEKIKISFSKEQNELLKILSDFYEEERYSRFDFFSYDFKDRNILVEYIQKYCKDLRYDYITGKEILLNTDTVKGFLGRIIGRMCEKYYDAIEKQSENKGIFCYELRYNSTAERMFYRKENKGSSQKKIDREKRAIKELLVYLMNSMERNTLIEYINTIEPLPFDASSIQEYIDDLCNKIVPIDLINEVEYMYGEFVENKWEREQMMLLIGDKGRIFVTEE